MDLASKNTIKELLKKHGVRPSQQLGQNFLIDRKGIRRIVLAAGLKPNDVVLEIGPGIGTLTQTLSKKAKKIIAVEKDQRMIGVLGETLKDFPNVKVVKEDILECKVQGAKYKVVGNLPFYLTAPVIRKFLESVKAKPQQMVVVVQKEVGQRICARPPKMNLLAVSVQIYSEPKIIYYLSKKSFWPQPKVDAAIVKIVPGPPLMGDRDLFFKIVKAGFSQPRKQLVNNLSRGLKMDKEKVRKWLLRNRIDPSQRAEALSTGDWQSLLTDLEKCAKMKG